MGAWIPSPSLGSGEREVAQFSCGLVSGRRVIGGRVFLTDRAMIHVPNRLDALTGAAQVRIGADTIAAVSSSSRTLDGSVLSGGARRRLVLTRHDGEEVLLVVNGLDEKVEIITGWLVATREG